MIIKLNHFEDMFTLWKPIEVHVFPCSEMPLLYTVQVNYLFAGFISWDTTLGTNLTHEEVEATVVPRVSIWGPTMNGPFPKFAQ